MTVVRRTPYRNAVQNSRLRRKVTSLVTTPLLWTYSPASNTLLCLYCPSLRCYILHPSNHSVPPFPFLCLPRRPPLTNGWLNEPAFVLICLPWHTLPPALHSSQHIILSAWPDTRFSAKTDVSVSAQTGVPVPARTDVAVPAQTDVAVPAQIAPASRLWHPPLSHRSSVEKE